MPVRRLRSLEEAEEALWRSPDDPALWRAIAAVWELSDRLFPRSFPPGVYKHRSMGEANRSREQWEARAIRRVRR